MPTAFDSASDSIMVHLRDRALRCPEFATKTLWQHILNKLVFREKEWPASTRPIPEELEFTRHVHIVAQTFESGAGFRPFLLWRGQPPPPDNVEQMNKVAVEEAGKHLDESEADGIWVMTGYGPYAKVGVVLRDRRDELIHIWPRGEVVQMEEDGYVDYIGNEEAYDAMFAVIKANVFPTEALVKNYLV